MTKNEQVIQDSNMRKMFILLDRLNKYVCKCLINTLFIEVSFDLIQGFALCLRHKKGNAEKKTREKSLKRREREKVEN